MSIRISCSKTNGGPVLLQLLFLYIIFAILILIHVNIAIVLLLMDILIHMDITSCGFITILQLIDHSSSIFPKSILSSVSGSVSKISLTLSILPLKPINSILKNPFPMVSLSKTI